MIGSRPRVVLLLLALASAAGGCTFDGPAEGPVSRIVLISIDTLRADRLGAYGHSRPTSPTLDAFAAEGVRFARCSTTSPWTAPSHTSMLTGLYPSRHGIVDQRREMHESVGTLAGLLRARGFETAAVVNSELTLPCERCRAGFGLYEQLEWKKQRVDEPGPTIKNRAADVNATAFEWLRALPADAPFFLFLHYYDVHNDYSPEPEFGRLVGASEDLGPGATEYLIATRQGKTVSAPELEQMQRLYDGEIRQLDARIGELFAELRQRDAFDDALIVVTSDHGEEFGEHGGFLHGRKHYEEALHVPLLIRGPGVPAGRVVESLVSVVDIMPTILEAADVPVPAGIDGRPLGPLFAVDAEVPWAELAVSEADHMKQQQSVRDGRYKLIRRTGGGAAYDELYDLVEDPDERRNLASTEPAAAARLRERLRAALAGESLRPARPETPEEIERLRALGYVE